MGAKKGLQKGKTSSSPFRTVTYGKRKGSSCTESAVQFCKAAVQIHNHKAPPLIYWLEMRRAKAGTNWDHIPLQTSPFHTKEEELVNSLPFHWSMYKNKTIESWNGLGWKGPQWSSSFNPPAVCRVTNQQTRLPRATSSLALNASRDGASTASLGNLLQNLRVSCRNLPANLHCDPRSSFPLNKR